MRKFAKINAMLSYFKIKLNSDADVKLQMIDEFTAVAGKAV